EWDHWMRDLKKSKTPQINEAAFNTPRMTTQLLDDFTEIVLWQIESSQFSKAHLNNLKMPILIWKSYCGNDE
ncbi:hypothetical protein BGZ79_006085, partial [Entomortierella chlamydospora]